MPIGKFDLAIDPRLRAKPEAKSYERDSGDNGDDLGQGWRTRLSMI